MRHSFYTENSHQLLFTAFDSVKSKKTNLYRNHFHTELELGYIMHGRGDYILNGEHFDATEGDLFFVRPNEQHCMPTIHSEHMASFNLHISSYYLWNICAEYIRPEILCLMTGNSPIPHRFDYNEGVLFELMSYVENPDGHRFRIRRLVLELIEDIANQLEPYSHNADLFDFKPSHLDDIQNAIAYIGNNLSEDITLDDIAKSANLSRSHLSALFKNVTGVSPYEYLLLQRIERAVGMLITTNSSITDIAYECGFRSQANFNKKFKHITGTSPSAYRKSRL